MEWRRELENRPDIHESRIWQTEAILSSVRSQINSAFRRSYHDPDEYIQVAGEESTVGTNKSQLDWPLSNSQFRKDWVDETSNLPSFDRSLGTRQASIGILIIGALVATGCFAYSTYVYAARSSIQINHINFGQDAREVAALAVLTILTFLTDQLSYVHSVSLRWALYNEGRLDFNSNIRLFTSSKNSLPNSWFSNLLSMFFLVLSYAAVSQLFIQFWLHPSNLSQEVLLPVPTAVNVTAIFALGIGLLGQTLIGVFCIIREIPSWSSNPLNTTLAALRAGTKHNSGRCMLSVHDLASKSDAYKPKLRQSNALKAKKAVRWVLVFMWVLALLSLIPILAWVIVEKVRHSFAAVSLSMTPIGFWIAPSQDNPYPSFSLPVQSILALLLFCGMQGLQTVGLHCAELLVNMARDEGVWRQAAIPSGYLNPQQTVKKGATYRTNSFVSATFSWQNAILFIFKAVMHWQFSQTVALASVPVEGTSFDANGVPTTRTLAFVVRLPFALAFGISAIIVSLFVTYLAFMQPKGPQPASFGHIQTLADLIDDWRTNAKGNFWWGSKDINRDGTRHAGTSPNLERLGKIAMDALYAG